MFDLLDHVYEGGTEVEPEDVPQTVLIVDPSNQSHPMPACSTFQDSQLGRVTPPNLSAIDKNTSEENDLDKITKVAEMNPKAGVEEPATEEDSEDTVKAGVEEAATEEAMEEATGDTVDENTVVEEEKSDKIEAKKDEKNDDKNASNGKDMNETEETEQSATNE